MDFGATFQIWGDFKIFVSYDDKETKWFDLNS